MKRALVVAAAAMLLAPGCGDDEAEGGDGSDGRGWSSPPPRP